MFEIYSKSDCIYCTKIKDLMKYKGLEYTERSLDDGYTKQDIQARVGEAKKINVIPQVFFHDKYIGGYLEALEFIAFDRHK